jgi:hypothetical protein
MISCHTSIRFFSKKNKKGEKRSDYMAGTFTDQVSIIIQRIWTLTVFIELLYIGSPSKSYPNENV